MWGTPDLSRIEALLVELTGLVRELLRAQGRNPLTPATGIPKGPPRDASAVSRVTREQQIQREKALQADQAAPWRSGPASGPVPRPSGDA